MDDGQVDKIHTHSFNSLEHVDISNCSFSNSLQLPNNMIYSNYNLKSISLPSTFLKDEINKLPSSLTSLKIKREYSSKLDYQLDMNIKYLNENIKEFSIILSSTSANSNISHFKLKKDLFPNIELLNKLNIETGYCTFQFDNNSIPLSISKLRILGNIKISNLNQLFNKLLNLTDLNIGFPKLIKIKKNLLPKTLKKLKFSIFNYIGHNTKIIKLYKESLPNGLESLIIESFRCYIDKKLSLNDIFKSFFPKTLTKIDLISGLLLPFNYSFNYFESCPPVCKIIPINIVKPHKFNKSNNLILKSMFPNNLKKLQLSKWSYDGCIVNFQESITSLSLVNILHLGVRRNYFTIWELIEYLPLNLKKLKLSFLYFYCDINYIPKCNSNKLVSKLPKLLIKLSFIDYKRNNNNNNNNSNKIYKIKPHIYLGKIYDYFNNDKINCIGEKTLPNLVYLGIFNYYFKN